MGEVEVSICVEPPAPAPASESELTVVASAPLELSADPADPSSALAVDDVLSAAVSVLNGGGFDGGFENLRLLLLLLSPPFCPKDCACNAAIDPTADAEGEGDGDRERLRDAVREARLAWRVVIRLERLDRLEVLEGCEGGDDDIEVPTAADADPSAAVANADVEDVIVGSVLGGDDEGDEERAVSVVGANDVAGWIRVEAEVDGADIGLDVDASASSCAWAASASALSFFFFSSASFRWYSSCSSNERRIASIIIS